MKVLSSKRWQHPNIIELHEVYHSKTHVLLQMEDGGSRNLQQLLRSFDLKHLPLGMAKAESIMTQTLGAICHMHMGPMIAHRDVKPENVMAHTTTDGDIVVQLCDFDLARFSADRNLSKSRCGTFPFMAPEMMDGYAFDVFAADIWSSAIVCLEVLGGVNIVPKIVCKGFEQPSQEHQSAAMTTWIGRHFAQPGSVRNFLDACLRTELKDCINAKIVVLVEGMLSVPVAQRWTATEVVEVVDAL